MLRASGGFQVLHHKLSAITANLTAFLFHPRVKAARSAEQLLPGVGDVRFLVQPAQVRVRPTGQTAQTMFRSKTLNAQHKPQRCLYLPPVRAAQAAAHRSRLSRLISALACFARGS
jgi:hypothetical protein